MPCRFIVKSSASYLLVVEAHGQAVRGRNPKIDFCNPAVLGFGPPVLEGFVESYTGTLSDQVKECRSVTLFLGTALPRLLDRT